MAYGFGAGTLFGTRTDIANATPTKFGVLQDVSVDFSGDIKELYGQSQFPVAAARGKTKIQGKAKFAQLSGATFNNIFFGQTMATGSTLAALSEAGTVPAVTTYTITPANAATFKADLGVFYALTGAPLTLVSGAPTAAGQYAVNTTTGVYTFFSADASAAVLLNYEYTSTTIGTTITIGNPLLGVTPTFKVVLNQVFNSQQMTLVLNQCVSSKLSLPTKQDDFTEVELDFMAFADASNTVGTLTLGN